MSFLSESFCWFLFLAITQTEGEQRKKCIGDAKSRIAGEIDDESLKEDLGTCKHFLVDSEMQTGRHRVFYCAMERMDEQFLRQKLGREFAKLKFAAKLKVAVGFVLKNVENGGCQ